MELTSGYKWESLKAFDAAFPDDASCRQHIFEVRYGQGTVCRLCGKPARWRPKPKRRTFISGCCHFEISPTSGTFLSATIAPIRLSLYALLLTSILDGQITTVFLAKHLGVDPATALRISSRIRTQMSLLHLERAVPYSGKVYVDEMSLTNLSRGSGPHIRGAVVFGITDGTRPAFYCVPNRKASTLCEIICRHVMTGTTIVADGYASYNRLARMGYRLSRVIHTRGMWKNEHGDSSAHIENCWREVRQRIENVHQRVDTNYLWSYLGQLSFILHCRNIGRSPFWSALARFPTHTPENLATAKRAIDLR